MRLSLDAHQESYMPQVHPLQIWAWLVAVVGGLVAAGLALWQAAQNHQQREKEHRWRQAAAGRDLVDEMLDDEAASDALAMLDSDERQYELDNGHSAKITAKQVLAALKLPPTSTDASSVYVRECFDSLFYYFARFEHFISTELTRFEDVREPAEYYVEYLAEDKDRYIRYLEVARFRKVPAFLARFPPWQNPPHGGAVPTKGV